MVLALVATCALVGCGGASSRPYVGGRFDLDEAQFFTVVSEAARGHGYPLEEEDPAAGRFAVTAHTSSSRGRTARFVVQCYRPGWFQVTAEGSAVRRSGETMSMSGDLFEEYRSFSIALVEAFGPIREDPR